MVSPEEYLELDRKIDFRSEYVAGEIVARAAGTPRHSLVTTNLQAEIGIRLKCKQCLVFGSTLRVCVSRKDLITYPDITVLCGAPQFFDDRQDTLTNPTLLVEVLSPSTTLFDRGDKSHLYRRLPSLKEYLLVDPNPVEIEHWTRMPNDHWDLETLTNLNDTLHLSSLDSDIPIADIYANIEIAPI